jgi:hypothetical protein
MKKEPSSLRYGCAMGGQRADRSFEWFFYSIDLMFLFPLIDPMPYAITYFVPSLLSRAIPGENPRAANPPNNMQLSLRLSPQLKAIVPAPGSVRTRLSTLFTPRTSARRHRTQTQRARRVRRNGSSMSTGFTV